MIKHIIVNNKQINIEMGCDHPKYKTKVCNGNCGDCKHSVAKMTIPDFIILLEKIEYKMA